METAAKEKIEAGSSRGKGKGKLQNQTGSNDEEDRRKMIPEKTHTVPWPEFKVEFSAEEVMRLIGTGRGLPGPSGDWNKKSFVHCKKAKWLIDNVGIKNGGEIGETDLKVKVGTALAFELVREFRPEEVVEEISVCIDLLSERLKKDPGFYHRDKMMAGAASLMARRASWRRRQGRWREMQEDLKICRKMRAEWKRGEQSFDFMEALVHFNLEDWGDAQRKRSWPWKRSERRKPTLTRRETSTTCCTHKEERR